MKIRVTNYTFNAAAGTVTFTDYNPVLLDAILLITNVTDNVIIYNFADSTKGGTVSTNVLNLAFDTSTMSDTDDLQIFYDNDVIPATDTTLASLGMVVTNAIDQTAYALGTAPFSATTNISNDYILDNIEFNFSTALSKTITVTSADGTVVYQDTNTSTNLVLSEIEMGLNGGENITVTVTQTSGACAMDCVVKVRQGGAGLTGNPVLGAGSEIIGKVLLVDSDGDEVTNQYANAVRVISTEHSHVHAGRMFTAGYYAASIANNASIELLIQVGANPLHLVPRVACGGDATLRMFVGPTFSPAGTAVQVSNHLGSSSNVSTATITHTPTVTVDGSQFDGIWFLPGGTGGNAQGGFAGFDTEVVLTASTNYLLRLTNISGNTNPGMINVQFYEPDL